MNKRQMRKLLYSLIGEELSEPQSDLSLRVKREFVMTLEEDDVTITTDRLNRFKNECRLLGEEWLEKGDR